MGAPKLSPEEIGRISEIPQGTEAAETDATVEQADTVFSLYEARRVGVAAMKRTQAEAAQFRTENRQALKDVGLQVPEEEMQALQSLDARSHHLEQEATDEISSSWQRLQDAYERRAQLGGSGWEDASENDNPTTLRGKSSVLARLFNRTKTEAIIAQDEFEAAQEEHAQLLEKHRGTEEGKKAVNLFESRKKKAVLETRKHETRGLRSVFKRKEEWQTTLEQEELDEVTEQYDTDVVEVYGKNMIGYVKERKAMVDARAVEEHAHFTELFQAWDQLRHINIKNITGIEPTSFVGKMLANGINVRTLGMIGMGVGIGALAGVPGVGAAIIGRRAVQTLGALGSADTLRNISAWRRERGLKKKLGVYEERQVGKKKKNELVGFDFAEMKDEELDEELGMIGSTAVLGGKRLQRSELYTAMEVEWARRLEQRVGVEKMGDAVGKRLAELQKATRGAFEVTMQKAITDDVKREHMAALFAGTIDMLVLSEYIGDSHVAMAQELPGGQSGVPAAPVEGGAGIMESGAATVASEAAVEFVPATLEDMQQSYDRLVENLQNGVEVAIRDIRIILETNGHLTMKTPDGAFDLETHDAPSADAWNMLKAKLAEFSSGTQEEPVHAPNDAPAAVDHAAAPVSNAHEAPAASSARATATELSREVTTVLEEKLAVLNDAVPSQLKKRVMQDLANQFGVEQADGSRVMVYESGANRVIFGTDAYGQFLLSGVVDVRPLKQVIDLPDLTQGYRPSTIELDRAPENIPVVEKGVAGSSGMRTVPEQAPVKVGAETAPPQALPEAAPPALAVETVEAHASLSKEEIKQLVTDAANEGKVVVRPNGSFAVNPAEFFVDNAYAVAMNHATEFRNLSMLRTALNREFKELVDLKIRVAEMAQAGTDDTAAYQKLLRQVARQQAEILKHFGPVLDMEEVNDMEIVSRKDLVAAATAEASMSDSESAGTAVAAATEGAKVEAAEAVQAVEAATDTVEVAIQEPLVNSAPFAFDPNAADVQEVLNAKEKYNLPDPENVRPEIMDRATGLWVREGREAVDEAQPGTQTVREGVKKGLQGVVRGVRRLDEMVNKTALGTDTPNTVEGTLGAIQNKQAEFEAQDALRKSAESAGYDYARENYVAQTARLTPPENISTETVKAAIEELADGRFTTPGGAVVQITETAKGKITFTVESPVPASYANKELFRGRQWIRLIAENRGRTVPDAVKHGFIQEAGQDARELVSLLELRDYMIANGVHDERLLALIQELEAKKTSFIYNHGHIIADDPNYGQASAKQILDKQVETGHGKAPIPPAPRRRR